MIVADHPDERRWLDSAVLGEGSKKKAGVDTPAHRDSALLSPETVSIDRSVVAGSSGDTRDQEGSFSFVLLSSPVQMCESRTAPTFLI